MANTQVTLGELQDEAKRQGIDPDQSYEELRDEIDVNTCQWCQDEYITGWSEKFCTDGCEVEYHHEFYGNEE